VKHSPDKYATVAFRFCLALLAAAAVAAPAAAADVWRPDVHAARGYAAQRLGQVSFALIFIGFNVTFFTQFFMGSQGMPRRYFNYLPQWQIYHQISTVGSWILGVGFLVYLWMLIDSLRRGEKAPDNPWQSLALEWQTHSPPVLENFAKTPVVTHGPYDYHLAKPAN